MSHSWQPKLGSRHYFALREEGNDNQAESVSLDFLAISLFYSADLKLDVSFETLQSLSSELCGHS